MPFEFCQLASCFVSGRRLADDVIGLRTGGDADQMGLGQARDEIRCWFKPLLIAAALPLAADHPHILVVGLLAACIAARRADPPLLVAPEEEAVRIGMRVAERGGGMRKAGPLLDNMQPARRPAAERHRGGIVFPGSPHHDQLQVGIEAAGRQIVGGLGRNRRVQPEEREGRVEGELMHKLAPGLPAQPFGMAVLLAGGQPNKDAIIRAPAQGVAVSEVCDVAPIRHRRVEDVPGEVLQIGHIAQVFSADAAQGFHVIQTPLRAVVEIRRALVVAAVDPEVAVGRLKSRTGIVEPALHFRGLEIVKRHRRRGNPGVVDPAMVLEISGTPPGRGILDRPDH